MSKKTLIAMRGYIVIKQQLPDDKTASGIELPNARNKISEAVGTVTSVGPTARTCAPLEGARLGYAFGVGDVVIYNPTNAILYKVGEQPMIIVPEGDVVARIGSEE